MMADAPMTSYMVHRIIEQRGKTKLNSNVHPKINLTINYETYENTNSVCPHNITQYQINKFHHKHKKSLANSSCKNVPSHNSNEPNNNKSGIFSPCKIAIQLDFQHRRSQQRVKKVTSNFTISPQNMLMNNSLKSYMIKVEKQRKKKTEQCRKLNNFGLNIKQIDNYLIFDQGINLEEKPKQLSKIIYKTPKIVNSFAGQKNDVKNQIRTIQSSIMMEDNQKTKVQNKQDQEQIKCKTQKSDQIFKELAHSKRDFSIRKQRNSNQLKSTKSRFMKMISSMTIVLNSYNCYLQESKCKQQQKLKKCKKYMYYIGKGNNRNLLVATLKKRWWWVQTDDINSANLVWTQLKVNSIIKKQSLAIKTQQKSQQLESYKQTSHNLQKISKKYPYFYNLFHKQFNQKYFMELPESFRCKKLQAISEPQILHNHFAKNYVLGNKNSLFYQLCLYYNFKKNNVFDIIPKTCYINSSDYDQFYKMAKGQKNAVWIIKPGQNSNRGKGIFISDNIDYIVRRIDKNLNKHSYIIQKYIKNNFLFQKRKFDIRTYLLIIKIKGNVKYFWYHQGYLRTSSQQYDLNDLSDTVVHLTNDAIQINSQNYGKFQSGNKITYNDFQKYLDNFYNKQKYKISELNKQMKSITTQMIKATYYKINQQSVETGFQLFGMDFIIDSKFKPWLIEVNTNPCLQLTSPCLQRFIPRVIENMFRLAVDPLIRPNLDPPRSLAHQIYENMLENNKFQLIFDSQFDRDLQWQKKSLQFELNNLNDDQQQRPFYNDVSLINIEN